MCTVAESFCESAMRTPLFLLLISATLALFAGACSKQSDVKASASELEKVFQTSPAPVPGQTATASAQPSPTEAQDLVKAALAAARADDYASGVIALEAAQRVTAEQVMVVQRTLQAMAVDLVNRAANGDQKALAQLKAIEKTRSQ
jgi:hypothetical protein